MTPVFASPARQRMRALRLGLAATFLACIVSSVPRAAAASASIPEALQPDAGETMTMVVPARGVQIYECRASNDGAAAWSFVAPEADLFDAGGKRIGRHYAGPHWEADDGSKLIASVKARADAPVANAIPWLLLGATPLVKSGLFARVTSVQRVNTVGGVAPSTGCSASTLGATTRVAYSADYVMFARK